jgi:hypothetical protein
MTTDNEPSLIPLPTSTHLVSIPFPSPRIETQLIAHLTLFQGPSVLLWCGECAEGWQPPQASTMLPTSSTSSSLLMEQNEPPQSSSNRSTLPPLTGHLASEWAVAMTNTRTKTTNSTSLYRFNADLAKPMSARLCEL